jgi:hypothetical protein
MEVDVPDTVNKINVVDEITSNLEWLSMEVLSIDVEDMRLNNA